eukprot:jgi/Mesvir1/27206/Mv26373-RA.1
MCACVCVCVCACVRACVWMSSHMHIVVNHGLTGNARMFCEKNCVSMYSDQISIATRSRWS